MFHYSPDFGNRIAFRGVTVLFLGNMSPCTEWVEGKWCLQLRLTVQKRVWWEMPELMRPNTKLPAGKPRWRSRLLPIILTTFLQLEIISKLVVKNTAGVCYSLRYMYLSSESVLEPTFPQVSGRGPPGSRAGARGKERNCIQTPPRGHTLQTDMFTLKTLSHRNVNFSFYSNLVHKC